MAIAKFTIEMAADLGQLKRDVQNINQVVSQMGGQIAQHYKPGIDALNAVGTAHNKVADQARLSAMAQQKSARAVQQQNIQMANQLQDFAIQVAGGQNPLLAFAQQGSQLSAVYGGVGNALRAVVGLVTPMTAAVTAGAVAVGGLAYAFFKGNEQSAEFRKSLALTGNAAGQVAGDFDAMIVRVSESADIGAGKVREMGQALVSTGRFGPQGFEGLTQTASLMAQITGKTAQEVAQDFAAMADAPAAYADKANKSLHFLTDAELRYIEKLEANGQRVQAFYKLREALDTRFTKTTAENLGYMERVLKSGGEAWSDFWNKAMGLGRADSVSDELDRVTRIVELKRDALKNIDPGSKAAEVLRKELQTGLAEKGKLEDKLNGQRKEADDAAAKAAAETAATEKRRLGDRLKAGQESVAAALSELAAKRDIAKADEEIGRLQAEQARSMSDSPVIDAYYKEAIAKQELLKIDRQRSALQADLARAQASGGDKPEDNLAAQQKVAQVQGRLLDLDKQRGQVVRQLGTDQAALGAKQAEVDKAEAKAKEDARGGLGAYYAQLAQTRTELEFQAQLIGKTVLEQEKLAFARGISARAAQLELEWTKTATDAGLDQIEINEGLLAIRNEQARALEAYGKLHSEQYALIYDAERGASEAVKDYMRSVSEAGVNTRNAVGNVLGSLEDGITNFAMKGKADIKSFANTVISEFIRIKVAQPFVGGVSNFIGDMFSGGGTSGGSGTYNPLGGDFSGISEYSANGNGNAFTRSGVHTFAAGGAFTNQIVTHPKRFAFAGGTALGLMGEAGPEAVMPLQRDSRGRLGVAMSGGGGGMPSVTVNVINQGGQGAEVTGQRTRQDGNGNMTIDVMVRQLTGALADDVASGSGALYHAMSSRFAQQGAR